MAREFFRRAARAWAAVALMASLLVASAAARAGPAGGVTVVLVHGALIDGSSWRKVIPLLQARGLKVVAVQNPLTSLADDVAATRRAIAMQDGPVLLVGHSWGGVVITEAGMDPKVVGLVYVAALAPDVGQSATDMLKGYPPGPAAAQIKPTTDGFLVITPEGMREVAQDLPAAETTVMAATQAPIAAQAFDEKVTAAAWKAKPSWYIVAGRDRAGSPDMERAMAKTIKATTVTLPTSHFPMLSEPAKVAAVILDAAMKAGTR